MNPGHNPTLLKINKCMRVIHIYSAMPVLLLMLFFAVTGFYLNHPEIDSGNVTRKEQTLKLPAWVAGVETWDEDYSLHVLKLLYWLDSEHGVRGVDFAVERDDIENLLIFDMSGPNGSSIVEVSLDEGLALVDTRELSALATLNNLHRAKHVTGLWRYLSDISALCMLIFCLSGCWLIAVNRLERVNASVAMVIGSGLFVLVVLLMH